MGWDGMETCNGSVVLGLALPGGGLCMLGWGPGLGQLGISALGRPRVVAATTVVVQRSLVNLWSGGFD